MTSSFRPIPNAFKDKYNASVGYFILETSNVANPIEAMKFLEFISSEKGLSILKSYGFQGSDE